MTFQVLPGVQIFATKNQHRFFHTQKHRVLLGTNLACLDELKKHKFFEKRKQFHKSSEPLCVFATQNLAYKAPFCEQIENF